MICYGATVLMLREAHVERDVAAIERLWLDYLTWGNDEMESRYGFRLPVAEAVERDLATIEKFGPPDGRLLLACTDDASVGIVCMQRIASDTAEIKRMYVEPAHRGAGIGRSLLDELLAAAISAGYRRVWLDSPAFMTAAHALYRSAGFVDIAPYSESEIPDQFKAHWVFMERRLT